MRSVGWVVAVLLLLGPGQAHAAPISEEAFERILLLLSVVSLGYVVTYLALERLSRRFGFGHGIEYILLGAILGPTSGLIDPELARDIRPLLSLGAGALGMLVGLELRGFAGSQTRATWFVALLIVGSTATLVTALPLGALAVFGYDLLADEGWTGALIACGVVILGSDSTLVRRMTAELRARGIAPQRGAAVAQHTQAIAVIGFGVLFAVLQPGDDLAMRTPLEAVQAFGLQIGGGLMLGFLVRVIVHRQLDDRVLLTVVIGMVFLAGGLAYSMNVSAIFVNFVMGAVIARTCRFSPEITQMMESIKHPFVIALYFFAGLEWSFGPLWLFGLVPLLIMLRWFGRRLGSGLGSRMFTPPLGVAPATISPGGLAVAFMLTLNLSYRHMPGMVEAYGPLLVTIVLLEFRAARAVRRWLLDTADVPVQDRQRPGPKPSPQA